MTTQLEWHSQQKEHVLHSAANFRLLLNALARPGTLNQLPSPALLGSAPLRPGTNTPLNLYALAGLLTLLDAEVSFAIASNGRWLDMADPAASWLALRSGAKLVEPNLAHFAFFCEGTSYGLLSQLNQGTPLEPENSATAFYCVESLGAAGLQLELSGPGILDSRQVAVAGLEQAEVAQIMATRRTYPLGLDIFLIDQTGNCLGLPRTTRIN